MILVLNGSPRKNGTAANRLRMELKKVNVSNTKKGA